MESPKVCRSDQARLFDLELFFSPLMLHLHDTVNVDPHSIESHLEAACILSIQQYIPVTWMSPSKDSKRAVRIAGASGGFTDRVRAIKSLAQDPDIDAIVGDWLSENVMTGYGAGKINALKAREGKDLPLEERMKTAQYASTFLQCFEPSIPYLAKNGAKLAVNAGASDTELLAQVCKKLVKASGFNLKVAWVEGDDVTDAFISLRSKGEKFPSLIDGMYLDDWGFEPISAQCYLGSLGIAEALRHGADIVICGRVSDAAPTIGVAA